MMPKAERHLSHTSPIDEATGRMLGVSGDEFRTSIYDFLHVSYSLIDIRREAAGNIGLNSAQFSVLSMANALAPAATPSEIAKALRVTNAFVTIEAAKLETLGLIEKKTNPEDARSVLLALTDRGLDRFNEAYTELRHMNALVFADFSPEEFAQLRKLIGKLGESIGEVTPARPYSGSRSLPGAA